MKISDQNEKDSGFSQGGQMTNLDLQKHMVFPYKAYGLDLQTSQFACHILHLESADQP